MNVLVVLIPVSLLLGAIGLVAFLWTVKSDQYEDAEGNAARILLDDD
ncbi:MAG: cbb3-type cytochrome oxidase assembly protein CcoS [Rhodobacter sp.]|jgi:cbb3-type cytochrome oxidase maturation protein|nr:cbb3-type cytochrome oxidase assembly protein CcoS [Rhodobacter sp.]